MAEWFDSPSPDNVASCSEPLSVEKTLSAIQKKNEMKIKMHQETLKRVKELKNFAFMDLDVLQVVENNYFEDIVKFFETLQFVCNHSCHCWQDFLNICIHLSSHENDETVKWKITRGLEAYHRLEKGFHANMLSRNVMIYLAYLNGQVWENDETKLSTSISSLEVPLVKKCYSRINEMLDFCSSSFNF